MNNLKRVRTLAILAMLAAISVVLIWLVHFPIIPVAPWLEYDPADIPILIGTLIYGPVMGLVLLIAAAGVQAITVSAQSGVIGFVMHVIATGTMVLTAGLIQKRMKSDKGILTALIIGACAMIAIMIPANLILTPIFYGQPRQAVIELLLPAIIPFNAIKSLVNGVFAFLIFQRVRGYFLMHK